MEQDDELQRPSRNRNACSAPLARAGGACSGLPEVSTLLFRVLPFGKLKAHLPSAQLIRAELQAAPCRSRFPNPSNATCGSKIRHDRNAVRMLRAGRDGARRSKIHVGLGDRGWIAETKRKYRHDHAVDSRRKTARASCKPAHGSSRQPDHCALRLRPGGRQDHRFGGPIMNGYLELEGKRALSPAAPGRRRAVVAALRTWAPASSTARSMPRTCDPATSSRRRLDRGRLRRGGGRGARAPQRLDIVVHVVGGSSAPAGALRRSTTARGRRAGQNLLAAVRLIARCCRRCWRSAPA